MKYLASSIALTFFVLGIFSVAQLVQAAEDNSAPVITDISFSTNTLDTGDSDQVVTLTMTVTDDLVGVCIVGDCGSDASFSQMQLRMKPLIGTQKVDFINFTRISGDDTNGVYEASATFPRYSKVGIWVIAYAFPVDKLNNHEFLLTDDIATLFPNKELTIANTDDASSVTIEEVWEFSSDMSTVTFPADTVVTKKDGGSYEFYKMVNQSVSLSGTSTKNLVGDVVQSVRIGVPGLNLVFSKDVSVAITVPHAYQDATLLIQGLAEGGDTWANQSSCTIGPDLKCHFTVNHATYYAVVEVPIRTIVTGTKAGGGPEVRLFDTSGTLLNSFDAYTDWWGGINVAVGDINGDGAKEIVVSTRQGGVPTVKVFDVNGNNKGWDFDAFAPGFRGGVNIAVGDIEGDGTDEIVVAPMSGGAPQVRIFGMRNGSIVPVTESFYAYDTNFRGGIALSIGDIEGDGIGDIITTPISGGGPHVRVFGVKNKRYVPVTLGVMAFVPTFRGGVTTAMADFNGNGKDEIIAGIYSAGGPQVRMIGVGSNKALALSSPGFFAFHTAFRGGVSVAALDTNGNGREEVIVGVGGQDVGWVKIMSSDGRMLSPMFQAYGGAYRGGITVAAGVF